MAPLQHVLHKSCLIITDKILLQYVFAYVSSDYHFGEILTNTPCKKKVFFFSPVCVAICVFKMLPCENSAAIWLFFMSYVYLDFFPCGNPAPHSLQLHSFSPVCKLVCCFGLSLLKNPAQHSLQLHCFPPACFWIWHLIVPWNSYSALLAVKYFSI